jgi:type I restriction enzyme M protein
LAAQPPLHCPIRGSIRAALRAKDGLTFTEEKWRIEFARLLLRKRYPKEHIAFDVPLRRFGHDGRNSLRADVVVYDRPVVEVRQYADPARQTACIRIVAEIKRERMDSESAQTHQLIPELELIQAPEATGACYAGGELRVLAKTCNGAGIQIREVASTSLPAFGARLGTEDVRYRDLRAVTNLVKPFEQLDDVLHQAGHARDDRYAILFKVLLLKIFDEKRAQPTNAPMIIQDFSLRASRDADVLKIFRSALRTALSSYARLPHPTSDGLACSGATLREVARILCPIDVLGSSPQVLQDFFMYFGRFLYKTDLGQYFTPYEVIDLIVRIVNPRFGDRVLDPACGTADFLVGAKRVAAERHKADIASQLVGIDTAPQAVNLSVFNLMLNGHAGADIEVADSLQKHAQRSGDGEYTAAFCNPPFGTSIVEKRRDVLSAFDLGTIDSEKGRVPRKSQETGLLFVEVCLKAVRPGGRVGIILPNGYLGNRSARYVEFREWLLRHARIAAVIGFPRFTFKKSGADVSASAVILERRKEPLRDLAGMPDFPIHFNLVEKVGWDLRSRRSRPLYQRDPRDGSLMRDPANQPLLDSDLAEVLKDLYASAAVDAFEWLGEGVDAAFSAGGWTKQASAITARPDLCLDPKRWCRKHAEVIRGVSAVGHFRIGEVLRPVDRKLRKSPRRRYRYVEIEQIDERYGAYASEEYFGWALPGRGRHVAAPGDVFIAHIWSSAGKWMIAGDEAQEGSLIVTSGCSHFEIIPGREPLLADLVFGLCSEAFKVQMRALATGSDGLSSTSAEDIRSIVLPKIVTPATRASIEALLKAARQGHLVLPQLVRNELATTAPAANIPPRASHVAQV